jgi:hypothetical protein
LNHLELERLFHELDRESDRLRCWCGNLEFLAGDDYGIDYNHAARGDFLEATAEIARAAEALGLASQIVCRIMAFRGANLKI